MNAITTSSCPHSFIRDYSTGSWHSKDSAIWMNNFPGTFQFFDPLIASDLLLPKQKSHGFNLGIFTMKHLYFKMYQFSSHLLNKNSSTPSLISQFLIFLASHLLTIFLHASKYTPLIISQSFYNVKTFFLFCYRLYKNRFKFDYISSGPLDYSPFDFPPIRQLSKCLCFPLYPDLILRLCYFNTIANKLIP